MTEWAGLSETRSFRAAALANGYPLVRVHSCAKAPLARGWQKGEADETLLNVTVNAANTGLNCRGFRVVDLDVDDEAIVSKIVQLCLECLPAGCVVRRRAGSPRLALVYRAEGTPGKRAVEGRMGKVEVLGAGQQVVIHGVHPSGVPLTWMKNLSPATVAAEKLPIVSEAKIDAFLNKCAAILGADQVTPQGNLAPRPDPNGSALLGPLASCFLNLPPDDALSAGIESPPFDIRRLRSACLFLARAGKITEREGWRDRLLFPLSEEAKRRPENATELKSLFDEISALAGGDTTHNEAQWGSSLSSHVDDPITLGSVFASARELGWDDPAERRAKITYIPGEIARAAEEAEAALIGGGAKLFRRGSNLVRPEFVETTGFKGRVTHQSLLRVATVPMLVRMMSGTAIFKRWIKGSKKTINPPEEVARGVLVGQDTWRFPSVAGVVTSPTLRPDGSILAVEGYDPDTKLYVAKIPEMPPIPEALTRDHALRALADLDNLLDEFPFEDVASRSVGLSGMLTTVCRGAFPVAPLHAVTAPTPGSGKSYLIDVIAAVANGNFAAVFTWSTSSEENEKRIDGALLDGSSIIAIDNISMDFGGDKICQTVERPLASVRRLGQSDRFEVENRATVFATGGNLILKGDITRRALVAVLDPRIDRPELRQFRHKPTEVVFADRGRFIAAALTVVAAYMQAGQPNKLPTLASFEAWSDTIRSALVWLGCADPVETMKRVIDEDPDHQARVEFCRAWAALGGPARTVDQLMEAAEDKAPPIPAARTSSFAAGVQYANPQFREALFEVAGFRGIIDKDRLAKWLRTNNARVIEGNIITKHKGRKALWSI